MERTELEIRDAINVAIDYMKSLAPLLATDDLRLEETAKSQSGNWLITISLKDPAFRFVDKRDYKTIEIDPVSKKVVSMKIRNPFAEAS